MTDHRATGRPRSTVGWRGASAGFTTMETLTLLVLLLTLARVAWPAVQERVSTTRAAEVADAVETVEDAARRYLADQLEWPAGGYVGVVPEGLADYLPEGFAFQRAGYRLGWENWALTSGLPADPNASGLLGVTVVTTDRSMGRAVVERLGVTRPRVVLGDRYTFITDRR